MKLFLVMFLVLAGLQLKGQVITYKFRIRYADYSPMSNSKFIISGQGLTTDPQGVIDLKISPTISYVNIGSPDAKVYEIKYPLEGKAVLPKDPSVFVDIFVSKPSPDELKMVTAQIMSSQATLQSNILKRLDADSKKGYDQIVGLLQSKNLDDTVLARGRLQFFPLISSALNNYLNEARNFNDAFLMLSSALNNKQSYDQLSKAIYDYNAIFDLLNANKSAYEQAIATYWNSKELSLKFSSVVDNAIENFHRPYILEINYTYINRIYQANAETNRGRRAALQNDLSKDMQTLSAAMSHRLNELGDNIITINTLLNNNNIVKN